MILLGKIGQLAILDVGGRDPVIPEAVFREIYLGEELRSAILEVANG